MSRRKRHLSEDDRSLWDQVRKTATPLHPQKRTEIKLEPKLPKVKKRVEEPMTIDDFRVGQRSSDAHKDHNLAPSISSHLAHAPVRMDRKSFGKLQKGKLSPEARIDLHGMTMAQAHPALLRFVAKAHAADKRLVLVITGKGKHRDEPGPIPIRHGVLKHQVPHWLHTEPLRAMVLQISEAHLKHGGSGAYYVYLRRRR